MMSTFELTGIENRPALSAWRSYRALAVALSQDYISIETIFCACNFRHTSLRQSVAAQLFTIYFVLSAIFVVT